MTSKRTVIIKLVGDSDVGKTSIINRYIDDKFTIYTQSTVGVDYKNTSFKMGEYQIKLIIWDTAGQEKYRTLTSSYYRGAHAMCMVFSISDRNSFENLNKWVREYDENCGDDEALMMLVGNKVDLNDRVVTSEEANDYAKKHSMLYTEVSAKTSYGIKDLFVELAFKVVEQHPKLINDSKGLRIADKEKKFFWFSCCCIAESYFCLLYTSDAADE
eukprot:TRINITY_DN11752_c0_g1_i2.p1 TRINITY_DN11752_c0_g1~~TRINITY_DN11752_c0_g1_i2.p1  ORF type:complete len:215 (-),score=33.48 TRINITY_DN11752_c0_g1_i2:47-691(-)